MRPEPAHAPVRAAAVSIDGVSKRFATPAGGVRTVLDDVRLEIDRADCVGIIGPNGAGKSTLLRVVAGVTPPTTGRVTRPANLRSLIELGAAVSADLSGEENAWVLANLWCADRSDVEASVRDGLAFAGLGEAESWPVRQYSSGMMARLVFGVATARPSELLLVDEVLSVGDLDFQSRCRARLAELRRAGTTILLVSHDLDLVGATCDRVVLLRDGRVVDDGEPNEVIRHYLGLPPEEGDDPRFRVGIVGRPPFMAGEPVDVVIDSTLPGAVLLELVIDEHPALVAAGIDLAVVAGSAQLEVQGRTSVRIDTSGLPPLRYSVHAALDGPEGPIRSRPGRLVLDGIRPELCAAQLRCEWSIESHETGS